MILLGFPALGAGNPVVGTWDCVSNAGVELTWTLVVKEDGSKLSGSLIGGPDRPGEIPLTDLKLDGNTFTFRVYVNPQCTVGSKVKIQGNKFDGTFGCEDSTAGTIKGTKKGDSNK